MIVKRSGLQYWKAFFHPRVFIFLLVGTLIIFLTFFTTNNALEIAISGIASVFIGIGVNNFSSFETKQKDAARFRPEIAFCVRVLETTAVKIDHLCNEAAGEQGKNMVQELKGLSQFIALSVAHLKDDELRQWPAA